MSAILKQLAIFGAGAAAREMAVLARRCYGECIDLSFVVNDEFMKGSIDLNIPVVSWDSFIASKRVPMVIALGDPRSRERVAGECLRHGVPFGTLIHPSVEVSQRVAISPGAVVCAGTVLTTDIRLGRHVYVNVGCTISHDVNVDDFATFSPGVHIAGWVTVGRRVVFGTGSCVRNGSSDSPILIGDDAIVGAGACVTSDVARGDTVIGVPARSMRRRKKV
jgi:sugar O-acyltransferase (sialic acid O-acetyltransferase NeuD family)